MTVKLERLKAKQREMALQHFNPHRRVSLLFEGSHTRASAAANPDAPAADAAVTAAPAADGASADNKAADAAAPAAEATADAVNAANVGDGKTEGAAGTSDGEEKKKSSKKSKRLADDGPGSKRDPTRALSQMAG